MMMGTAHGALAADMPILRGGFSDGYAQAPMVDWQGFYIGGQAGTGRSDMNFSQSAKPLIARMLANTVIEHEMRVSIGRLRARNRAAMATALLSAIIRSGMMSSSVSN